jgi:MtN3 and saliva related transmembrane protein
MDTMVTALGLVSSAVTVSAYMPQVIKSWQTRELKDISFLMLLLFTIGSLLWITYGYFRKDIAVIISNIILFILQLSLIYLKIKDK